MVVPLESSWGYEGAKSERANLESMLPSPSYFRIEPRQFCCYFLQRLTVYKTDGKSTRVVVALKCGRCLVVGERVIVEPGVVDDSGVQSGSFTS